MPPDRRGIARAPVNQNSSSSPVQPRPNVAQRQPLQTKHVHRQNGNCGVTGCRTARPTQTPKAQNRGPNQHLNQHSQHLQRVAQAKTAQPRVGHDQVAQRRVSNSFESRVAVVQNRSSKGEVVRKSQGTVQKSTPIQAKMAPSLAAVTTRKAASPGRSNKSVVQRMEVPSTFDASKAAKSGQWVVTQVDSELGGMFGHSELFIECYSGVGNKSNYKIHVQTLHQTRVDILALTGPINLTHVRGSKSYVATDEQVQKIWSAARIIQQKMSQGIISYAEIFPDRKPAWKEGNREGQVEMSCKSVTDTLLIEAGLRTSYGGTFLNHPSDL
jgi:hypothetical protein